jgi:GT2 family glycosyltransferase
MDDDTIPDSNCLERLVDNTEVEKNISFLSSYVYGTDGNTMNVPEIELNSKSSNGCKDFLMHLDKKMIKISNATFVSILVNGEAVKKIGIPCDFFFIWGDDIEYTYRLTRFFGPAYLVGSSKALHKRKSGRALSIFEETDKRRIEFQKFGVRNSLIVGKEYFSKKKFAFIFLSKLKIFLKLVFSNTIEKKMKIKYFSLGIIDYLTGNYDKLAFKERLKK